MDTTTSSPIPDQIASSGSSSRQDGPQGPVPAPCPQGGIPRPAPQPPQLVVESTEASRTLAATYDPGDNKLRLRSLHRLDEETYRTVRTAGFIFAPRQDLFVAPSWTPEREDLLLELCGEVGDEDTSLVERAEERADRFETYSEKRGAEADGARAAVDGIAQRFEGGQPILVGHHSEKRARKDAERIQNGMRRAVKLWETSKYWTARAAGALRHAKYKELPGVRYRRIKTIEADQRKAKREREESVLLGKLWASAHTAKGTRADGTAADLRDRAMYLAERDRVLWGLWGELDKGQTTPEAAQERASARHAAIVARCDRWIGHCDNRIAYERAMLDEGGGLKGETIEYQPGGRVLRRGKWFVVKNVNRQGGAISSISVIGHFASTITPDEVQAYEPPKAGDAEKVKAATKLAPLVNFPGDGFIEMTEADWKRKPKDYRVIRTAKATETHGAYRYREAFTPGGSFRTAQVFITDAKVSERPALQGAAAPELPTVPPSLPELARPRAPRPAPTEREQAFADLKEQARAGVTVVSAPQLFPTPMPLATRKAALAQLRPGDRVLEPSAGTGNIVRAVLREARQKGITLGAITAVEINEQLARVLATAGEVTVIAGDFLAKTSEDLGGPFDRIVMNPPFTHGADIQHVQHALRMLAPGGRLVAVVADGPRQHERLRPLIEEMGGTWEPLPEGTFEGEGTSVRTALVVVEVRS